jgi:hypothetical protein
MPTLQVVSILNLFKPSVIADIKWLTVKIWATGNISRYQTYDYEGSCIFKFDARQKTGTDVSEKLVASVFFLSTQRQKQTVTLESR